MELSYKAIRTATEKPEAPIVYISKDSTKYQIGDTLKLGTPSGVNGRWVYIFAMTWMGEAVAIPITAANTNVVIKKFYVGGTRKQGFKVSIFTKGNGMSTNYSFYVEDAIAAGEVIDPQAKNRMSSDQALGLGDVVINGGTLNADPRRWKCFGGWHAAAD